jgi:hypothetical protein
MSAVQQRFDDTLSRADELLRERLRREEQELARQTPRWRRLAASGSVNTPNSAA